MKRNATVAASVFPSCAEGAIQIKDGKARLVAEKFCDGLGACLGECPNDALKVIEREAEDFDEGAVGEHLKQRAEKETPEKPCGCPSARFERFLKREDCKDLRNPLAEGASPSTLSHWPVQIRLVSPAAPFLKGADLLVAADCTPVAYPNFHGDFLKGKAVMIGCPKFDEAQAYVQKFADVFAVAGIRSVTVVTMEVPCCQGLPLIVRQGMEAAGKKIPMEQIIISTRGEILKKQKIAA